MKRNWILLVIVLLGVAAHARQPHRGYRGFLEWGNDIRTDNYWGLYAIERKTSVCTGFMTSHGYQFNPYLYVGAGLGFEYSNVSDCHIIPLFLDGRTDLKFGRFTPFFDVRLGVSLTEGAGVYFSPTIGYRFNWGRKVGINLGVGMTLQGYACHMYSMYYDFDHYDENGDRQPYPTVEYNGVKQCNRVLFSIRLGFDF